MGSVSQHSYAWHDSDDSLEEQRPTELGMAGLPESWRHYEWKVATVLFIGLWLADLWTSGTPLPGIVNLNHMAQGIWALLIVLAACLGLFRFWIGRRPSVGYNLCILVAGAALLGRSF